MSGNAIPYVADRVRKVDTVASIWAAPKQSGDVFRTKGRVSIGDSAGQDYVYNATGRSTVTQDYGNVIFGTDGDADDYIVAVDRNTLTPEKFGAVGDDSTDDYTALSRMFSAVGQGSNVVIAKQYAVSGKLLITGKSGFTITGAGRIRQTGSAKKTIELSQCSRFQIGGLTLQGLGTETPWSGGSTSWNGVAGIHLDACSHGVVDGCVLTNHAGGGIRWSSNVESLVISNNIVEGMGDAAIAQVDNGGDFAIGSTGNVFSGVLTNKNIVIAGNCVSGHAFGIGTNGIDATSRVVTINDNNISNIPGQHGIYVQDVDSVEITGNNISSTALLGIKFQCSSERDYTSANITGNVLRNCYQGISLTHLNASYRVRSSSVAGNTIIEDGGSEVSRTGTAGDGIVLANSVDVDCSGNTVSGYGRYGIYANGFSGNLDRNTIKNVGQAGLLAFLHNDTYIRDMVVVDAMQTTATPATTGRISYVEAYVVSSSPDNASPVLSLTNLTMKSIQSDQAAFTNCIYTGTGVVPRVRGLVNDTVKTWRFTTAPQIFGFDYSRTVDFYSSAQLNPTTPIYGRGRRVLYGTQNPATASMTDYFRPGDVCFNATPVAGGKVGWVCTVAGNPGTWKAFGAIDS